MTEENSVPGHGWDRPWDGSSPAPATGVLVATTATQALEQGGSI